MSDVTLRAMLVQAGRRALTEDLSRCLRGPGAPRSVALVGLPGFLVDEQFALLEAEARRAAGCCVVCLKARAVQAEGTRHVVDALCSACGLDASTEQDESGAWDLLRNEAPKRLGPDAKILVFLRDFHEFQQGAGSGQVRSLLDWLQVASTEEPQWLAVACCSHVSPALVCADVGWSPFYKVFGLRVLYAGLLERRPVVEALAQRCREVEAADAEACAEELAHLGGDVPEIVAELAGQFLAGRELANLRDWVGKGAIADPLEAQVRRYLTAEQVAFCESHGSTSLSARDEGIAKSCRRLGLLQGERHTPLAPTARRQHAAVAISQRVPHIRGLHQLECDFERALVEQACVGTHFTQLDVLQGREGEALVVRLNREDERGRPLRPRILKITATERLRKEADRQAKARERLGDAVPGVTGFLESGAMAGLVLELACADNREYSVRRFLDVFRSDVDAAREGRGPTRHESLDMLKRTLRSVLASLYQDGRVIPRRPCQVYPGPSKPGELSDLQGIWDGASATRGDALRSVGREGCVTATDLGEAFEEALKGPLRATLPTVICPMIHGDLNPRNFLLDGAGNLHIIDFSSFGEGSLCRDFARLEAEILLKLAEGASATWYVAVLPLLVDPDWMAAARRVAALPLEPVTALAMAGVKAVREALAEYATPHRASGHDLGTDYAAALGLTAARLALFTDYLDDGQRAAAAFLAALGLERFTIETVRHGRDEKKGEPA